MLPFILCMCPPSHIHQALSSFNNMMREATADLVGCSLSDWAWQKASLPSSLGGLKHVEGEPCYMLLQPLLGPSLSPKLSFYRFLATSLPLQCICPPPSPHWLRLLGSLIGPQLMFLFTKKHSLGPLIKLLS